MFHCLVPQSRKRAWAQMEEENAHGQRLMMITEYFLKVTKNMNVLQVQMPAKLRAIQDFDALFGLFKQFEDIANKIGYLPDWANRLRNDARGVLRQTIMEYYGERGIRQVNP